MPESEEAVYGLVSALYSLPRSALACKHSKWNDPFSRFAYCSWKVVSYRFGHVFDAQRGLRLNVNLMANILCQSEVLLKARSLYPIKWWFVVWSLSRLGHRAFSSLGIAVCSLQGIVYEHRRAMLRCRPKVTRICKHGVLHSRSAMPRRLTQSLTSSR